MNQDNITMLARIYNTLMTIRTSGEDTVAMGDCLKAFQQVIVDMQQQAPVESVSQEE